MRINEEVGVSEKNLRYQTKFWVLQLYGRLKKADGGKNTYSSKRSSLFQHGNCRSLWAANNLSDTSCHNFRKTKLQYYLKAEFRVHVDIILFSRSNIVILKILLLKYNVKILYMYFQNVFSVL